ncbi:hypothetical protein B4U80_13337 [Leptotrombidium deliense]|uniref:F-box domain-containing protein n=1 Tax=Leptotrombidium deliense TaxID=299467 RepID=A0A443S832_9ACAR|nr:hypothetical protein B4U80_13337 [Leptotrombidium deliense]
MNSKFYNTLPAEIWCEVFKHLSVKDKTSTGKVCKKWHQLNELDEIMFYGRVQFCYSFPFEALDEKKAIEASSWEQIVHIVNSFSRVKQISFLGDFKLKSEETIEKLRSTLTNVQSLKLYRCSIDSSHFLRLTEHLKTLKQVSFIHSTKAADTLNTLLSSNAAINSLTITGFKNAKLMPFDQRLKAFKHSLTITGDLFDILCALKKSSAESLETMFIANVFPSKCVDVICTFKNLKDLRISFYWFSDINWQSMFVFENLEILVVYPFGNKVHDVSFITKNRKLKVLALGFLLKITDSMIAELCDQCTDLRTLIIRNSIHLTNACFKHLIKFKKLEQLQLIDGIHISDETMASFVKQCNSAFRVLRFDGRVNEATVEALKATAETNCNEIHWAHLKCEKITLGKKPKKPQNLYVVHQKSNKMKKWNYFFDIQLYYRLHPNDDFFAWKHYKVKRC